MFCDSSDAGIWHLCMEFGQLRCNAFMGWYALLFDPRKLLLLLQSTAEFEAILDKQIVNN